MENFTELHSLCIKVFEEVTKSVSIFILPLFLGRIVFSSVVGEGQNALQTFKGVVIYFLLVAGFPLILEILFSIPESFLPKWETGVTPFGETHESSASSLLPYSLDVLLEATLALLYWVVYYVHIFFMILMSSMAPVIFLTGSILGIGIGIEIFIGLIIIGSCWPLVWFGFDQVHTSLAQITTDPLSTKCLELLVTIFKGLAPVTLSSLAIKSPAGQALAKSARVLAGTAGKGFQISRSLAAVGAGSKSPKQNALSPISRTLTPGLRKYETKDFERVLGNRYRRARKGRGEK